MTPDPPANQDAAVRREAEIRRFEDWAKDPQLWRLDGHEKTMDTEKPNQISFAPSVSSVERAGGGYKERQLHMPTVWGKTE